MAKRFVLKTSSALLAVLISLPSYGITIEKAWQQAKQSDPQYNKAQISVELGENAVSSSRSALMPSLNAYASSNWAQKRKHSNSYGATLSQTLWDSRLWSELDRSKVDLLKNQLALLQAHNQLAQRLLNAYLDMASAQGDLQLAQSKYQEGTKLLNIIEQRYKAGKIKSIDVEEIKATQVAEKVAILNAKASLASKKAELAMLINHTPSKVDQIRTAELVEPPLLVSSKAEWLKLAKDTSPELLAAIQNVKASEYAKKSAKGGYYPTLKGTVGYSDDDSGSSGEFSAGVTLNVPIDINGATRAQVDQASLNLLSAKQELRQVELDINKRIIQHFTQLEINWQQALMANQLVQSRTQVLGSKEKLYAAGMMDVSQLISAHNRLFEAKNNLQTNLYNYWRQRIGLLQIAGKLDDNSIALISQAFKS